jgi:hypothetical protein
MKIDRMAGAEALSASARAIALEQGVLIAECVWQIGDDLEHEHAHRLDLVTADNTVRLYFPDLELTTIDNAARAKRSEDRLRGAIAQLLPRSPEATYTYQ